MPGSSSSPAPSSGATSGIVTLTAVSTTGISGVASGTAAPSIANAKTTTAVSASPSSTSFTNSKKNVASQFHGFAGTAGILLLAGMFAGL
ncbi:MAG: hypothetical protein Q9175_007653 [Cornicularia normoerica]